MKTIHYFTAVALTLFGSSLTLADTTTKQQAVHISVNDASGTALPVDFVNSFHQVIANGISKGIIDNFVTYNQNAEQAHQLFACVQATQGTSTVQFNRLVNQLRAISPDNAITYTLRRGLFCQKDNTLVCSANDTACLNSNIVASAIYGDYQASAWVAEAMAEIAKGKSLMNIKLNQQIDVTSSAEVNLPMSSKYCSNINVVGTAADGNATIACTLSGNAAIVGKVVTWTRAVDVNNAGSFIWTCTTDVDIKYAGKCYW